MHRFYVPANETSADRITLTGREAHHARDVMRLRRGEQVLVLDGAGGEFLCEVGETGRDQIQLIVARRNRIPPLAYRLTLLQAIPKGRIFETIVQKATELGVSRVVPLLSERVATRVDDSGAALKGGRWQQTAIEAIKQCGSAWLPLLETPVTPEEFLRRQEHFDLSLIASLQPGSRHAREFFSEFRRERDRAPESVCVWVGPEGDFTAAELAAIRSAGARPISLGQLVLRSETAAVYCLSILNYELQSATGGRD